jgi:hypothetical protein
MIIVCQNRKDIVDVWKVSYVCYGANFTASADNYQHTLMGTSQDGSSIMLGKYNSEENAKKAFDYIIDSIGSTKAIVCS